VTGCGAVRGELGAYVVGALSSEEREAVDLHVAGCPECWRELQGLQGLSPFLAAVTLEEAERGPVQASGAILDRLLADVAADRRRGRRRRLLAVAAVAAAVAIIAGGITGALAMRGDDVPQRSAIPAPTRTVSGSSSSGVSVDLALERKGWGTALTIEVANVSPGHTCALVAVGRDGVRETAATWTVPKGGYREGNTKRSLTVNGAVGLQVAEIDRFEVVTPEGEQLLTVALPESAP
jgi:hypothetical protein